MKTLTYLRVGAILLVPLLVAGVCVPSCKKNRPYDLAKVRAEGDNILKAMQQYCLDTSECYSGNFQNLVPKYLPYTPAFGESSGQWTYSIFDCDQGKNAKILLLFRLSIVQNRWDFYRYYEPTGWEVVTWRLD